MVVVGLLGFVFWQNFVNNLNSTPQSSSVTEEDKAPVDTVETLEIPEWGVRGDYTSTDGAKVTYTIENDFIAFTTQGLPSDCHYGTGFSRFAGTEEVDLTAAPPSSAADLYASLQESSSPTSIRMSKVGEMYFFYQGPQSLCSADAESEEQLAHDFAVDATQSILRTLAPLE